MKKHLNKILIGYSGVNSVLAKHFVNFFKNTFVFVPYNKDINNYKYFRKWLNKNISINVFINFAGITSSFDCEKNKLKAYKTNYLSVIKIIEILQDKNLKNFNYFLSISSSHVFKKSITKLKENSIKKPSNFYGYTKLKMEKKIIKISNKLNFINGIARIFNYYHKKSKKLYFVNSVKKKLKTKNKKIYFYGVNTYRDFIDIDDICNAIYFMVIKKIPGDYNICSSKRINLKNIIKEINKKHKKHLIFYDTNDKDIVGNNYKLKKIGWKIKKKIKLKNFV